MKNVIFCAVIFFYRHQSASILTEALVRRCSVNKVFLEISQNSQENTSARVSFLIKLQNFIKKETMGQVFSFEFFKISKSTFFIEHL